VEPDVLGSWRLSWCIKQLRLSQFRRHSKALKNPWHFYIAMALKLIPRTYPRRCLLQLVDGSRICVEEFMTLFIYEEIFVDRCYDWTLPPNETLSVLDIGANTGLFALRVAQLRPGSTVTCYEPMPGNFRQLLETIELNHLRNATPMMKGVGGVSRRERLYVHPRNIGGHTILPAADWNWNHYVDIELVSMAAVLAELPSARCDLLKLDCEGAEKEIIDAITPKLAHRIPRIVLEPSAGSYDISTVLNKLSDLGYSYTRRGSLVLAELQA